MVELRMQTVLGRHHDIVKEFGSQGSPIRETFWKKVKRDRVTTHIEFLFKEKFNGKFEGLELKTLLEEQNKKLIKQLRMRGYSIT